MTPCWIVLLFSTERLPPGTDVFYMWRTFERSCRHIWPMNDCFWAHENIGPNKTARVRKRKRPNWPYFGRLCSFATVVFHSATDVLLYISPTVSRTCRNYWYDDLGFASQEHLGPNTDGHETITKTPKTTQFRRFCCFRIAFYHSVHVFEPVKVLY